MAEKKVSFLDAAGAKHSEALELQLRHGENFLFSSGCSKLGNAALAPISHHQSTLLGRRVRALSMEGVMISPALKA